MKKYADDGRTIYDMSGVGSPEQMKRMGADGDKKKEKASLSRKERLAAIRAGFSVYTPIFLLVIGCFTIVALLIYFWLK